MSPSRVPPPPTRYGTGAPTAQPAHRMPAPGPGPATMLRAGVIQGHFVQDPSRLRAPDAPAGARSVELKGGLLLPAAGGQRLPPVVQRKMEAVFKTSFADVRIHTAHEATAIGAAAFTRGSNIYFAPGRYDPATPQGERLLCHELAHVVQQRQGRVQAPASPGLAIIHDPMLEREAERASARVASTVPPRPTPNRPLPPAHRSAAFLQAKRSPSWPARVIQRSAMDTSEEVKESYPPTPPGGKDVDYYGRGAQFHTDNGDFDTADAYFEAQEKAGKKSGQSFGTGNESDNYDDSYVDIPAEVRPAAPAALWKVVYNGLTAVPGDTTRQRIACAELSDGYVVVSKATKCEEGTAKRPPMCHKVPFNHIRWAVAWLYANKVHPDAKGYKGPDVTQLDADTWKKLVWDHANLQAGHAACNSKTAVAARGIPGGVDQAKAKTYVAAKLKAIQPTWF